MELGALELQIFVSLIVILGTAFVALVCDYLKGSNESLREHNIELRVRREEQDKNRPVEAVEWLQQMLGATRGNPVRFGSLRPRTVPGRNRGNVAAQAATAPVHAAAPAVARPAAAAAVVAPNPMPAETKPELRPDRPARPVAVPAAARVAQPVAKPEPVAVPERAAVVAEKPEVREVAAVAMPEQKAVGEVVGLTRSVSGRMRRAGTSSRPTTSLLDTLPVPAWVKREQDEIAAARAKAVEMPVGEAKVLTPIAPPEPIAEPEAERAAEVALAIPELSKPIEIFKMEPLIVPEPVVGAEAEIVAEPVMVPESVALVVAEPEPVVTPEPVAVLAPVAEVEPEPFPTMVFPVAEVPTAAVAVYVPQAETGIETVSEPFTFVKHETVVSEPLPDFPAQEVAPAAVAAEVPSFLFSREREELPEVNFSEKEPAISIWRTDVEPIVAVTPAAAYAEPELAGEPEPVRAETFWSYRGLMDRELAKQQTPAPVEEKRPVYSSVVPDTPVAPPAPVVPVAVEPEHQSVLLQPLEAPKREELARDNFILYRGFEPVRPVETEPEFVGIETPVTPEPAPVVIEEPAAVVGGSAIPELALPAGYQDRAVLQQMLTATGVLTGVVVAIGINDYQHQVEKMGASAMQDLMRNVEQMIAGLLRPGIDFGCRSSEDEFVLVFNKEAGPEAQRRLSTISERLWNFQLRSLTSFSVFFSWGAVEVQGETLADAAASASERMYQTKRNRKTVTMDQRRKKAVNS